MLIEEKVARLLSKSKRSLSLAESCTGGLLANRLTNVPGSSNFLKAGLVAYCNDVKSKILRISPHILKRYGAVSTEVAERMSKGIRKRFDTDYGVGITGIAGPSGGSKQKPVGLTYISISTKNETVCLKCLFKGNRLSVKRQASTQALKLLLEFLT